MEVESGFSDLSEGQKDVIYAANSVANEDGVASIQDLQSHPLTEGMTRATFFRTLNALAEKDMLKRVGSERSGCYRLASKLQD